MINFNTLVYLSSLGLVIGVTTAAGQQSSLTLRQAIDVALRKNPEVVSARADVRAAHADALLARTALLPSIHFVEDISRGNDPVYVFGTKLRQQIFTQSDFALNVLNRPVPLGNFATRSSGTWTAFDWLKTQHQIRQAELMEKSASSAELRVNQETVLRVVRAYQSVLYAQRQIAVTQHQQNTAQALLKTVQTRVLAGLAVDADQMSAQVNVAERTQELIAAEGELDTSWAELETATGISFISRPGLTPIEPRKFPEGLLADEVAMALKARPDLKALSEEQAAYAAAVRAAKADFAPQLRTCGTWEMDRTSFAGNGGNNWVAGVQLDLDILPFAKRARLNQQEAARQKVDAQAAVAEDQIRLAVSRAHSERHTAERMLDTTRAVTEQAGESLRIVRNRYEAGLATITDLLRAEDAQRQNETGYWRAVYGNAETYAQLLYATGVLTPDTAEALQ